MTTPLETARANVASRYAQPYLKNTIIGGGWDTGDIVKDELARIEGLIHPIEEVDE